MLEGAPETVATVFDDMHIQYSVPKPDSLDMWNRIWVLVKAPLLSDTWNSETSNWNAEDNWNAEVSAVEEELRKIALRCRAAYNLFVGFIFVQVDGTLSFVNYNDE